MIKGGLARASVMAVVVVVVVVVHGGGGGGFDSWNKKTRFEQ